MNAITPVDAEQYDALVKGVLEGTRSYSLIYRHFMTVEERLALAVDGWTLADIAEGNVDGGNEPYRDLCATINARLGFRFWKI